MARSGRGAEAVDAGTVRSIDVEGVSWTVRAVGFGRGRSGTPLIELVFQDGAAEPRSFRRGLAVGYSLEELDDLQLREAFTRSTPQAPA